MMNTRYAQLSHDSEYAIVDRHLRRLSRVFVPVRYLDWIMCQCKYI